MNCPECGHNSVEADGACHTYGGVDADGVQRWYSCMNCYTAIEYLCTCHMKDDWVCRCGWSYTDGLNPQNPRAAGNEIFRPPWLEPQHSEEMLKHPDVPWLGEI